MTTHHSTCCILSHIRTTALRFSFSSYDSGSPRLSNMEILAVAFVCFLLVISAYLLTLRRGSFRAPLPPQPVKPPYLIPGISHLAAIVFNTESFLRSLQYAYTTHPAVMEGSANRAQTSVSGQNHHSIIYPPDVLCLAGREHPSNIQEI